MSRLVADPLPPGEALVAKAAEENFPVALKLLPKAHREHLMAVYGYARLVDDVGDELDGLPQERLAALDEVQAELDRAFAGTATHPVFVRLSATIAGCSLEPEPFLDLIEANRLDQSVTSYDSFEQLLGYCALSANPVGRLVLAVFGETGEDLERLSDLVCSGLQVVEHLQDVVEDAEHGRVYLPAEDMALFGVQAEVLSSRGSPDAEPPAGFRRLMAFEVSRVRAMLSEGSVIVSKLKGRSAALAVAGFAGGGLAQLSAIERAGYDVLGRRVKASDVAVAASAMRLLASRMGRARR